MRLYIAALIFANTALQMKINYKLEWLQIFLRRLNLPTELWENQFGPNEILQTLRRILHIENLTM